MGTVLKVDIDYKAPEAWLEEWVETREAIIEKYLNMSILRVVRHETTKGQNYFIEVDEELTPERTNEIQFLLGDDHTRVKINAWRIERGIPHWNKIFDRKLWRKKAKTVTCYYCGNIIPLIGVENDKHESQQGE